MVALDEPHSPVKLPEPQGAVRRLLLSLVERPLERLLYISELNQVYRAASSSGDLQGFLDGALAALGREHQVDAESLQRIPKEGPLLVVANHPFGAVEGIVLTSLLQSVRPDVKILANYLLRCIPPLSRWMLFVDPFDGPESTRANVAAMKQAIQWLRNGGVLGVFPSGEVSHLNLRERSVEDPPWQESAARLARLGGAPALPVFFEGRNGALFQVAGLVHPRLRTLMLPHALFHPSEKTIRLRIGSVVPFAKLASFSNDQDLVRYLRMRTYILDPNWSPAPAGRPRISPRRLRSQQPIVEPSDPALLSADVNALDSSRLMSESGEHQVWLAESREIPHVLREIGRLREVTFRLAGEGTGKALDLDRFDESYLHLFVWSRKAGEVVGAYRLARTDEIRARFGDRGLYTHTLFKLSPGFFDRLAPAVELGRSFIRAEYQKQHSPLALLWKGIGRFLLTDPRYKVLFGPVSISNEYKTLSQQMMIAFLEAHSHSPELARWVRPRNPPRWKPSDLVRTGGRLVCDVEEVSSLVSEIEPDQKGVPILLRQYLRLNAKFLCCNVDPDFSGVVDGLLVADLTQTDPRILERYMGKEGAAQFFRSDVCETPAQPKPTCSPTSVRQL